MLERVVAGFGKLAAGLLLIVALAQVAILVVRKLGFATVAAQETVMAFVVPMVLLAIPWALQAGRHVAVDGLSNVIPRRAVRISGLTAAAALAGVLLWLTLPYAWSAFRAGEGSFEVSGFDYRWAAKAVLPLFALLLGMQAFASLARER